MNTHVIILCQGEQKRLPELLRPKQLLPLPACGDTPILGRTLEQVYKLLQRHLTAITVVARREPFADFWMRPSYCPDVVELDDPGNSSLKGIARYLAEYRGGVSYPRPRTVVLLGDVVYSWACLETILAPWIDSYPTYRFVGTKDLSPSGGELWGLAWHRDVDEFMRQRLGAAVAAHPPYTEYQPGQLRRWLWTMPYVAAAVARDPGEYGIPDCGPIACHIQHGTYVPVDDYTRDIDLPEHVRQLEFLSNLAATDDKEHGLTW